MRVMISMECADGVNDVIIDIYKNSIMVSIWALSVISIGYIAQGIHDHVMFILIGCRLRL
jgi:hypothetical protein